MCHCQKDDHWEFKNADKAVVVLFVVAVVELERTINY